MPSTIRIDNQSFDPAIEHFCYRPTAIEDMSELAKLRHSLVSRPPPSQNQSR
jgi:hypothetical protein